MRRKGTDGFTLIEISIVLVIIGLIVGGVLVGQSLISAAGVRATISQIEKYNQAANTFRGKYGYLPGDIPNPDATNFGFAARGTIADHLGEGDGDGLLEGNWSGVSTASPANGLSQGTGETALFWVDLSAADLIEGTFNTASCCTPPGSNVPATALPSYFPPAKIGQGAYVYVYSNNGVNYFGVLAITGINASNAGLLSGGIGGPAGFTTQQAYAIDSKIDDGLPQSGSVTDQFVNGNASGVCWAGPNSAYVCSPPFTAATPGYVAGVSYNTCFNNGNVNGAAQVYSIAIDNGADNSCALSFKMQGAAR
jgi:prepilin-type N-terminal cleavage/methylation domain-containing protein